MKLFTSSYQIIMGWARHPHAKYYLMGVSFVDSSCLPIPPDVMLIPMSMATPHRARLYAGIATLGSVLGGIAGYLIGMLFFQIVHPWIIEVGYEPAYQQVEAWFTHWGFLAVLVAGFSPIPYKIFTISAGALHMPFIPFMLASLIGRSIRFLLVSGLMAWGGERLEKLLLRYVEIAGWVLIFAIVIGYLFFQGRHLHWF